MEDTVFNELGLAEPLLKAVAESGYATFTEFQEKVLPSMLDGESLIASAGEYSGRTLALLVPLIHRLSDRDGSRILVVAPTRTLAAQVHNEITRLGYYMDLKNALLDAGALIAKQAEALAENPHFVVGTPGRILDHLRRGNADFRELDAIVLLEVDRMIDQGQQTDVEDIVAKINEIDQVIQVAAVLSPPVLRFCRGNVGSAVEILDDGIEHEMIREGHSILSIEESERLRVFCDLMNRERPTSAVVFCRSKDDTARVADRLADLGAKTEELHAGMPQRRRRQIAAKFRDGEYNVLALTDMAVSHLDCADLSLVVNFDPPEVSEDYGFRLGQVAPLDEGGRVITLVAQGQEEVMDLVAGAYDLELSRESRVRDSNFEDSDFEDSDFEDSDFKESKESVVEESIFEEARVDESPVEEAAPVTEDPIFEKPVLENPAPPAAEQAETRSIPNDDLFHGGWLKKRKGRR